MNDVQESRKEILDGVRDGELLADTRSRTEELISHISRNYGSSARAQD